MGIRVIGQKKFEVTETELLQQDLLFYLDNPRVYSVYKGGKAVCIHWRICLIDEVR